MRIPNKTCCLRLIHQMEMMEHIVCHSLQVYRVAWLLADGLAVAGVQLDRKLVRAGALLHDITKTRSFQTGENHAETGGALLEQLGYPEVGRIVQQHVRLNTYPSGGRIVEAEIVNYADKRVLHDRVVLLEERMDYILERYAETIAHRERIRDLMRRSLDLERRIFRALPFEPHEVAGRLPPEELAAEMQSFHRAQVRSA